MEHRKIKQRAAIDLDDVLYGIHAVDEAIKAGEPLRRLHIANERRREPGIGKIADEARAAGATVRFEERQFFTRFPYKAHQGIVAFGVPFAYASLDALMNSRPQGSSLFVILDHITDPHNAGAIVRTAECAGATAVILPDRRSVGVNATVRKAAAGATAHLPIARVANVAETIRTMKKANIWVAGAALSPKSVDFAQADFACDLALVVGAEGAGLSVLAARECDYLVGIPLLGRVGSLNASVAAGILLFEAVRQRRVAACSARGGA